ncbi:MAG: RdgB/HAM1 family non-canonical purine NTP pyrophosphatase [Rhodothermaceae bacterium]|nr:RdgB/HAM1 family non-canonical purine NTP pyrophosphatase [Rhodothermaceae bacterium]
MDHPVVLIASKNPHKIEEMSAILAGSGIRVLSALDFPDLPDVEETGVTLEENAVLKAESVFRVSGLACVADDTGLEADALNGEPGVYSARYAGNGATYSDNVKKLLSELKNVPSDSRTARFRTVIALKTERGIEVFHGVCEGRILEVPAGTGGFGYDPVFRPDGYSESFAQMDASEKNRISHRGLALQKLSLFLTENPEYLLKKSI